MVIFDLLAICFLDSLYKCFPVLISSVCLPQRVGFGVCMFLYKETRRSRLFQLDKVRFSDEWDTQRLLFMLISGSLMVAGLLDFLVIFVRRRYWINERDFYNYSSLGFCLFLPASVWSWIYWRSVAENWLKFDENASY